MKQWKLCDTATYSIFNIRLYTIKELVMMESSIVEFHQDFYIHAIYNFEYHLPYVRIIGTHHCGNTRQEAFKRSSVFQYVLFHHDYAERVVASFSHQIQS